MSLRHLLATRCEPWWRDVAACFGWLHPRDFQLPVEGEEDC